jgi:helix-turn-helix protein
MQGQGAEWVTMAVAAAMFKVSPAKISRMASNGEIRTRENRRDKRVKLVNVEELRRYFEENPYTGE